MQFSDIIFLFVGAILFNPLAWVAIIVVVLIIRSKNKKNAVKGQGAVRSSSPPDQDIVADEFGALRLEEMARSCTAPTEKSILLRAAHALRYGARRLPASVALDSQTAPSMPAKPLASTPMVAQTAPHTSAPEKPTKPEIPLTERGLKALQNINILLYLGAFFVVIAAGVFIGSTYGSLNDATKVMLMAIFALVFYFSGLALYRFTDKIRPAGVTFTAIGLLVAPLVGVATQSLLFADKNPGPVWLVTSAVLVAMQVIAFMIIRKSYIAYYGALTTISLFQALTNTLDAPVYWYGWAMLATSMAYIFIAKFWQNEEFGKPFREVAQIFVPISVIISVIGYGEFGIWSVGVQLVLTALFYFLCAMLKDFDQSNEELSYIALATSLFPIGLGMVFWARDLPHLAIASLIMALGALYVVAEKLVPTVKHKPIYATVASVIFAVSPALVISDLRQLGWLVLVAGLLHTGHYLLTRFRASFSLLNITILTLPLLFGLFVVKEPLELGYIAVIYLAVGAIMTVLTQLVLKPFNSELVSEQDGFIVVNLVMAIVLGIYTGQDGWLTLVLFGSGAVFMSMALWRSSIAFAGTALSWYLAVLALVRWQYWTGLTGAWLFLAMAILIYGCYRLFAPLRQKQQLSLALFGVGLLGAYIGAIFVSTSWLATLLLVTVGAVIAILSFIEKLEDIILLAIVAIYGGALHLGDQHNWPVAISLFVCSLVFYAVGSLAQDRRSNLARYTALAGFGGALLTSFDETVNKWLAVVIHLSVGGIVMSESYKSQFRAGKYLASIIVWTGILRIYDAFDVNFSQLYIQTTALYLGALAYRQYQRGAHEAQDGLTVASLAVATVPLAFQALDDKTGGYILGILGLGLALTVFGMSVHYNLVRTWGIATLVVVVLYKTAGTIFSLPPWVWLGLIGITTLVGAIFLLSRRQDQDDGGKKGKI